MKRANKGRFQPGVSGNPAGRRPRTDAAPRGDGWFNSITQMGQITRDKTASTSFEVDVVDAETAMIIWRGDDLAARIVEAIPGDALREGFEIVLADDKPAAAEVHGEVAQGYAAASIARLAAGMAQAAATRQDGTGAGADTDLESAAEQRMRDLNVEERLREALCYERALGGAAILLGVTDYCADLKEPLDIGAVKGLEWISVLEPRELQPVHWYQDPFSPDFGKPDVWRLVPISSGGGVTSTMIEVHESRLILFPGTRVTKRPLLGASSGWGDSIFTRVARALRDFNSSHHSAAVLMADFAQAVYKIKDLAATVATDGTGGLATRMTAIDLGRSVARAILVDTEEDFERKATPMSGLPETLDRLAARLAAAADMPLTLLMGQSPGGLNATGASDVRFYYDRVAQLQKRKVTPAVRKLVDIIFAALGKPPGSVEYDVKYNPLWQETDKERSDARKVQADIDAAYCGLGVYTPDEVALSRFGGDTFSYETKIDFAARAAQAALAPPAPPAAPPGAAPPPGGPPGGGAPPRMDAGEWNEGDHPRDESGRFGAGGGGGGSAKGKAEGASKAPPRTTYTPQPVTFQSAGVLKLVGSFDEAIDPVSMKNYSDEKGGMTFHKLSHTFRTTGYSVAKYPERERVFTRNATVEDISQYVKDNADVFAADPDAHVGGWFDPKTGNYCFDVSAAFDSLDDAMDMAIKGGQAGIYDLVRGVTIEVDRAAAEARWKRTAKTDSLRLQAGDDARRNEGGDRRDAWRHVARRGADGGDPGGADRVDFDPDQARDESGKWTSGGAGVSAPPPKPAAGSAGASSPKPANAWRAHEARKAAAKATFDKGQAARDARRKELVREHASATPERQAELEAEGQRLEDEQNAEYLAMVEASKITAGPDTFNTNPTGVDLYGQRKFGGKEYPRQGLPGGLTLKEATDAAFPKPAGGWRDPVAGITTGPAKPTFDEVMAVETAWRRATLRSIALGELDAEVAVAAGSYLDGHSNGGEKVTDLPPVLYHVTTAADAVRATGLKTRAELGQRSGKGLGSGPDDTISFTPSRELAETVERSMVEYHDLLNGRTSVDAFVDAAVRGDGAAAPYIHRQLENLYGSAGSERVADFREYLAGTTYAWTIDGTKPPVGVTAWDGERERPVEPGEWTRAPERDTMSTNVWRRMASPREVDQRLAAAYKAMSLAREKAGGPVDPLFIGTDVQGFKAVPRDQIKTLKFKPKEGAQGYNGGDEHLAEWRTWSGDAVEVDDGE